ncbi:MAG: DNA polymerase IV [Corynebacterium sp.]|nr:DNA polymerase IV [Corynebacterium sp.]
MSRWVLHIDMDAFFASVEQLTRPSLRGRPILVGGVDRRGVVSGASYEARALGAHSAQPMYQAEALVKPRGVTVPPRFRVYSAVSKRVFQIFQEVGGVVEQISVDEGFLEPPDLVGATPEQVREFAEQLRAIVLRETGLHASVGAGSGRQFAKIASGLAKPNGICILPDEEHEEKLYPLSVRKLWGIGPVTADYLHTMGIDTIGQFVAMDDVESLLGKSGIGLWRMLTLGDHSPVEPRAARKQVSAEYTYADDILTHEGMDSAIERAFSTAFRRLQKDGRAARTVTVKTRMSDFHSETRSASLNYGSTNKDTLYSLVRKLVRYPDTLGAVRLVGVGFSGLSSEVQEVLFEDPIETAPTTVSTHVDNTPMDQPFRRCDDVSHPEWGHGWVTGVGAGFITVRFESRTRQTSKLKTFKLAECNLEHADPLDSLDWGERIKELIEED